MLNRIVLVGRLTRDPEARSTNSGTNVAQFSIAVDKRTKSEDSSANFFRCVAFGKTADFVTSYLTKGRLVAVEGRLEQRKYTDNQGNNRESFEIIIDNVQGLDRPRDSDGPSSAPSEDSAGGGSGSVDEFDPFAD
jgi:single-strand DNA-binding protein